MKDLDPRYKDVAVFFLGAYPNRALGAWKATAWILLGMYAVGWCVSSVRVTADDMPLASDSVLDVRSLSPELHVCPTLPAIVPALLRTTASFCTRS